ncbi:uncharacterized protein [Aegilops tauschii subsp. strangulata]
MHDDLAFPLHLQRISTLQRAAAHPPCATAAGPDTPPRTANAPPPCTFPTPASFHHQRHLVSAPHFPPIPLSRHDPTSSSSTTSPAPACSSSPRCSSSLGRSTCSSHHAQIDGAVQWSLPRLRVVQCCSTPFDSTTSPRGAHHVFAEKTRCTAGPFLLCFTVICREEMAIDEVELEPLEFAEKMHTQQELQQQQLEMLVQILKHCSESQSVILETLQRQLESADLDTSLSIFTPEQIQGIVEKYSS